MSKVAVVYWSGTGNTETMAHKVLDGAKAAGAEAVLFTAADFDATNMEEFDAVAFGCPSMGNEELEESELNPCFPPARSSLEERKSPFSAPMVGVTVSGCAPGNSAARMTAPFSPVTA